MPRQRVPGQSHACEDKRKTSRDYAVVETPAMVLILALARHRAWLDQRKEHDTFESFVSDTIDFIHFDAHKRST